MFNIGKTVPVVIFSLFISILWSGTSSAFDDSDRMRQMLSEIDRLENKIKNDTDRLEEKLNANELKLRSNEKNYSEILEIQKKSEDKLAEAEKLLSTLENLQDGVQDAKERLTKAETNIKNLETQLTETKADVRSSGDIIKWVTAIVSVIVIIVGLFFSKVFLELYANYQVLLSKYESKPSQSSE